MLKYDVNLLKDAATKATPGYWLTDYKNRYVFNYDSIMICEIRGAGDLIHDLGEDGAAQQMENNCKYIAAANPEAILALIEELEKAKEAYVKLTEKYSSLEAAVHAVDFEELPEYLQEELLDLNIK